MFNLLFSNKAPSQSSGFHLLLAHPQLAAGVSRINSQPAPATARRWYQREFRAGLLLARDEIRLEAGADAIAGDQEGLAQGQQEVVVQAAQEMGCSKVIWGG